MWFNAHKQVQSTIPNAFECKKRSLENPDEHQGRKRSIPHERGNWPSFAYLNSKYLTFIFFNKEVGYETLTKLRILIILHL